MPILPGNLAKITTGYLDTVNDIGVMSQVAGDITERNKLGQLYAFTNADALRHSSAAATRLYGGLYQYVKAGTALTKGQIVQWDTAANLGWTAFQVTSTVTAPAEGFGYGIACSTVTINRYAFIQVSGLANVLYRASVTSKVLGNIVIQLTTTATADAIADATGTYISGGALGLKNLIGTAYTIPVDGAIGLVMLKNNCINEG